MTVREPTQDEDYELHDYAPIALERYRLLTGHVEWGQACCGACHHAYRPREVIVDDAGRAAVEQLAEVTHAREDAELGLALLVVDADRDAVSLARAARSFDPTSLVAPNYILRPLEHKGGYFPDSVPVPAPEPTRPSAPGAPVTVGVVDTGVRCDHPWWDGSVTGDDEEAPATPAEIELGHGTFVVGVLKQVAPQAAVRVKGLGAVARLTDWTVAQALRELAGDQAIHVLNVSLGTCAPPDMPPPAMAAAVAEIQAARGDDVVIVAAAGNDASAEAPYPAALPGVVAVAATADGSPASYSNYGAWVDVCAEGRWVSAYFHGDVPAFASTPSAGPYCGFALWEGSSFAAPVVAAKIAEQLAAGAPTARDAMRRVRAASPKRYTRYGRFIPHRPPHGGAPR